MVKISLVVLATLIGLSACQTATPNNQSCSTAKISGMTCEACAMVVTKNLKQISGVQDVDVDVIAGTVKIRTNSASEADKKLVADMISKSGFKLTNLQSGC